MNYDKEALIRQVKEEIGDCGSWYLDWGIASDIYKNCPTRGYADEIASRLMADGYDIYIDRMSLGSKSIPEGTPICYRVYKNAYPSRNLDVWK